MNKLNTFIFVLIFSALSAHDAVAQRSIVSGSIRLTVQRPDVMQIEVSGALVFNETVQGGFLLGNLFPGDYWVKISVVQPNRRPAVSVFNQNVRIQPGQCATIRIDAANRVSVNYAADHNSVPLCTNGGDYRHEPILYPISDADLDRMLVEIKRNSMDNGKLKALEAPAQHYYFLSDQMGRIMSVFSFDDNKLKCAKMLIPKVLDPERLYLQANVFTFSSNRNTYLNLIR